jgi:hypothetical protein
LVGLVCMGARCVCLALRVANLSSDFFCLPPPPPRNAKVTVPGAPNILAPMPVAENTRGPAVLCVHGRGEKMPQPTLYDTIPDR